MVYFINITPNFFSFYICVIVSEVGVLGADGGWGRLRITFVNIEIVFYLILM